MNSLRSASDKPYPTLGAPIGKRNGSGSFMRMLFCGCCMPNMRIKTQFRTHYQNLRFPDPVHLHSGIAFALLHKALAHRGEGWPMTHPLVRLCELRTS